MAARFVMARAFGDHACRAIGARRPVERQAEAVTHLPRADLGLGKTPELAGMPQHRAEPVGRYRSRRGRKAQGAGSISPDRPVGACGPTNNCSRTPVPRWTVPPSVSSAVTSTWICIASGLLQPRSSAPSASCATVRSGPWSSPWPQTGWV